MAEPEEPAPDKHEVTALLLDWNRGSKEALDALMPLVTRELRRLARSQLERESQEHTLQPTALVNECYLRMIDRKQADWQSRVHFFAFAARTMRRILVDHARARLSAKRGSGARPVSLTDRLHLAAGAKDVEIIALDQALERLAALDERQSRLVELRFFAGLNISEAAEALGIAEATANRDWASARAWLYRELK